MPLAPAQRCGTRGRIASLAVLAGLAGCARPNALYGDDARSSSDTTVGGGTTLGADTKGTSATSRASTEAGATTDPERTTGTGPGSVSEEDDSTSETETETETETEGGPTNLLWISAPVAGNWDTMDGDPCGMALAETGARCASDTAVIIGREGHSIGDLPAQFDFLSGGPFHAATTGQVVLKDLNDLLSGMVGTAFVAALTSAEPLKELYTWRGPLDADPAPTCNDWSGLAPDGAIFVFAVDSKDVSVAGQAPCVTELALLCACEAPG